MAVMEVTKATFEQEVLKADKPVLVDFWASWCGPCKMQGPIIDDYAEANPEVKVCKINIDEEPDLAAQYKVMAIPTLAVFKDGEKVKSVQGFQDEKALRGLVE